MTAVAYEAQLPLARQAGGVRPARRGGALPFGLFILVNAALFVRPAELFPAAEGLPIYNILIVSCLAVSFARVLKEFSSRNLAASPLNVCVIALLPAVAMSFISRADFSDNFSYWTPEFAKIVLYYLLMVALVNTPKRMRAFLIWLNVFTLVLTVVALLHYHGYIHLKTISIAAEHMGVDGKDTTDVLMRLAALGIYDNPNDLARILVIGITICIFAITEKGANSLRFLWVAPMVVFAYALNLTYSRGGLLALLAGIAVLFCTRYGWKKAALVGAVVLPIMLVAFGGRQTSFDTQEGTGQHRIQLWAEGFELMRYEAITSPLFGIGVGRLAEELGYVAHNSFVQSYVELGFLGGTLFTGAYFLSAIAIYRLPKKAPIGTDPELWRFRPYVLSIVVGTMVGMLSSTRTYNLPTYMVLGLAAAYIRLTNEFSPLPPLRFNMRMVKKLLMIGIGFFTLTYVYVRLAVNWE